MKRSKVFLRIIDVNINRFREALRVCEDISRFAFEDKAMTKRLKTIRHDVVNALSKSKEITYRRLVSSRDTEGDVGKDVIRQELKRTDTQDILNANLQRSKESVRVLEEFFKVVDQNLALEFKDIRFKIYDIEKRLLERCRTSR